MSKCYEAYEQLSDLGWQVGVAGLKEAIQNLSDNWRHSEDVQDNWREAKSVLVNQIQDFVKRKLADEDDLRTNCPKIKKLIEVLSSYATHADDSELRIIVFIRMRSTAKQLLEILQGVPQLGFLRKGLLIGHGDSSNEKGMKTAKQVQVAKDFREGLINCLIATSVAEEGFDIAACNVVIRFDAMDNVTAFVQSRGRARKSQSDFVVIFREKDGELNLAQIKEQENHMLQAVVHIMTGDIRFEAHLELLRNQDARHFIEEDCPKILHEWCQKHYAGATHDVELVPHKSRNPKAPVRWSARIFFPKPVNPHEKQLEPIDGGMRKTEALAKRAAAYDACIMLHTMGWLAQHIGNDFLVIRQQGTEGGVPFDRVIADKPSQPPLCFKCLGKERRSC
jgi:endoribonuclease Dicer